jgi:hypothetical protein
VDLYLTWWTLTYDALRLIGFDAGADGGNHKRNGFPARAGAQGKMTQAPFIARRA